MFYLHVAYPDTGKETRFGPFATEVEAEEKLIAEIEEFSGNEFPVGVISDRQ
jgi:hypothetical protein